MSRSFVMHLEQPPPPPPCVCGVYVCGKFLVLFFLLLYLFLRRVFVTRFLPSAYTRKKEGKKESLEIGTEGEGGRVGRMTRSDPGRDWRVVVRPGMPKRWDLRMCLPSPPPPPTPPPPADPQTNKWGQRASRAELRGSNAIVIRNCDFFVRSLVLHYSRIRKSAFNTWT